MRKSIFPSIGREDYLLNQKGERIERTPMRRCKNCRMPNDTRRTSFSKQGTGLSEPTTVSVDAVPGQTNADTKEQTTTGGCMFCGSLNWQQQKPTALPDGRNYPASNWSRRQRRRKA